MLVKLFFNQLLNRLRSEVHALEVQKIEIQKISEKFFFRSEKKPYHPNMSQSINQTIDEGYTSFTSNASFEHQTQKTPKIHSSKTTEAQLKSLYSISKLIYDNNTARLYKATCRKTNQPVIIKRMLKTKSSPDEITLAVQANQVRIVES